MIQIFITIKIRRIYLWTLFTEDVLLVVIRMIKIYEHAAEFKSTDY